MAAGNDSIFDADLVAQATPEVVFANPSFAAMMQAFADALQTFLAHVNMAGLDELRVKARITTLPEDLLDHLGLLDFRAVGYATNLPIDQKRALVMSACYDNAHLGTKTSVAKLLNLAFANSILQEWWEYGGQPYHFRILTTDPFIDPARVAIFNRALEATKPVSRWPDATARIRDVGDDIAYLGIAFFALRIRQVGSANAG